MGIRAICTVALLIYLQVISVINKFALLLLNTGLTRLITVKRSTSIQFHATLSKHRFICEFAFFSGAQVSESISYLRLVKGSKHFC